MVCVQIEEGNTPPGLSQKKPKKKNKQQWLNIIASLFHGTRSINRTQVQQRATIQDDDSGNWWKLQCETHLKMNEGGNFFFEMNNLFLLKSG